MDQRGLSPLVQVEKSVFGKKNTVSVKTDLTIFRADLSHAKIAKDSNVTKCLELCNNKSAI